MLYLALFFAVALPAWFDTENAGPTYCQHEVAPGVYDQCTLRVPGTAETWTDGVFTWAGNPYCVGPDYNFTLQPDSPAIDAGAWIADFHCPQPGSALTQPANSNGTLCKEWYGAAPDIGACEWDRTQSLPNAPSGLDFDKGGNV